jgi:hypothetical protein
MSKLLSDAARTMRREWLLLWSTDAANDYQNMGFDVLERYENDSSVSVNMDAPLWLNYGYWKGVDTQNQACCQLADLVAEAARMKPGDRVLDCGFGFAEQDMHWLATRNPGHITGINITPMHTLMTTCAIRRPKQTGRCFAACPKRSRVS